MTRKLLKLVLLFPVIGVALGIYTFAQFVADVGHMSGVPTAHVGAIASQPANVTSSAPPAPSALSANPAASSATPLPQFVAPPVAAKANPTINSAIAEHTVESDDASAAMTQHAVAMRNAASSNDVEVRRDAILGMAQFNTPETIDSLSQTLHDTDTQNRFLSVESLRQLGMNLGDADGSIRTLLRNAALDNDPTVANHAREAIAELAESSQ